MVATSNLVLNMPTCKRMPLARDAASYWISTASGRRREFVLCTHALGIDRSRYIYICTLRDVTITRLFIPSPYWAGYVTSKRLGCTGSLLRMCRQSVYELRDFLTLSINPLQWSSLSCGLEPVHWSFKLILHKTIKWHISNYILYQCGKYQYRVNISINYYFLSCYAWNYFIH